MDGSLMTAQPMPPVKFRLLRIGVFGFLAAAASLSLAPPLLAAAATPPTISPRDLPDALRQEWAKTAPDLTATSRCATTFDSHVDPRRMTFNCSIYVKVAAEGERRAMRYCEAARKEKGIAAACRIIAR